MLYFTTPASYVGIRRNVPGQIFWFVNINTVPTHRTMVAAGVEAIGHHDGRISEVSIPVSSCDHGEYSGRLVLSQSKRLLIGGPSTQSLPLTPLASAVDMAGTSSDLHVIDRFFPNQAYQYIIYGMPGGSGDFQMHRGDTSQ